jgi:hypothetical protein
MPCLADYDELMSLKLDGLLANDEERHLDDHIKNCADCGLMWAAMRQANELIWVSAREPLPVPSDFQAKVMMRLAAPAPARQAVQEYDPLFLPGFGRLGSTDVLSPVRTPALAAIAPAHTRRLNAAPTGYLPGVYADWQNRVLSYVRGVAAVALSIAGVVGLLLALTMSGTIQLTGPAADAMGVVQTFVEALDGWVRSLFVGIGPGIVTVSALMLGIMLLVGWQVVSAYQRAAAESRGNTGVLEAVA